MVSVVVCTATEKNLQSLIAIGGHGEGIACLFQIVIVAALKHIRTANLLQRPLIANNF